MVATPISFLLNISNYHRTFYWFYQSPAPFDYQILLFSSCTLLDKYISLDSALDSKISDCVYHFLNGSLIRYGFVSPCDLKHSPLQCTVQLTYTHDGIYANIYDL